MKKTHSMRVCGGLRLPLLEMRQPRGVTGIACLGSKALGVQTPAVGRAAQLQGRVSQRLRASLGSAGRGERGLCLTAIPAGCTEGAVEGAAEVKPGMVTLCLRDAIPPPGTGDGFAAGALHGAGAFLISV